MKNVKIIYLDQLFDFQLNALLSISTGNTLYLYINQETTFVTQLLHFTYMEICNLALCCKLY